jgi:Fungal Zn(2)-Cys(6) binuclear cluster domain
LPTAEGIAHEHRGNVPAHSSGLWVNDDLADFELSSKARCDSYLHTGDKPCSRCKKLKLECLVIESFEREHKRRKLYQLQNETEILRDKLKDASADQCISVTPTENEKQPTKKNSITPDRSLQKSTLPRVLDGFLLESDEIDALFKMSVGTDILLSKLKLTSQLLLRLCFVPPNS